MKRLFLLLFFCFSFFSSEAAELIISGIYNGKNLTIQNPSVGNKVYCTDQVIVNNKVIMTKIVSSIYEINLSYLTINDSVTVIIVHKDDCTPKILNPQVLRPSATFQFVSVSVDKGEVKWSATGEKTTDTYFVEHATNGTWITVQKFKARGIGIYNVPVIHNFGANKYRVRYAEMDGNVYYSKETVYDIKPVPKLEPVTFYPKSVSDKIFLSRDAAYQITTINGNILKKGSGKEISLVELKTGVYILAVDNRKERFFKK